MVYFREWKNSGTSSSTFLRASLRRSSSGTSRTSRRALRNIAASLASVAFIFLPPLFASAAIAFDNSTTTSTLFHATSATITNYVATTNNPYVVVDVTIGSDVDNITSVTFGGTAMTQLGKQTSSDILGAAVYMYGVAKGGTGDIVASFSGTQFIQLAVASYSGVNQTTPTDGTPSFIEHAASTDANTSMNTIVDNDWTVSADVANTSSNVAGTGTTRRQNNALNFNTSLGDSGGPITPAGAYAMHWTLGTSVVWKIGMIALQPATATPVVVTPAVWQTLLFW